MFERRPYCIFFEQMCISLHCPVFQLKRSMNRHEREVLNSNDIPVIDPYIYDWCIRYNKSVQLETVITEEDFK